MCPFSGVANPRRFVRIWYPKWGLRIPVPLPGAIWARRTVYFSFPASSTKATIERGLRFLTGAAGVVTIVLLFIGKLLMRVDEESAKYTFRTDHDAHKYDTLVCIALAGLALYFVSKWLRLVNLRAVSIVESDGYAVEVRFAHEDYVREFCALNGLVGHGLPFKKRQRR